MVAASDYGYDVSTWSGSGLMSLDPLFRLITGNRLLAEVALRRMFCAPGSYLQVPGFQCVDLLAEFNRSSKEIDVNALSSRATAAIRADERFDPRSTCKLMFANGTLSARLQLVPSQGAPFSLTVTVQQVATSPKFNIAFPQG